MMKISHARCGSGLRPAKGTPQRFADLYGKNRDGEPPSGTRPPGAARGRIAADAASGLCGLLGPLLDHLIDNAEVARALRGEELVALERIFDRL